MQQNWTPDFNNLSSSPELHARAQQAREWLVKASLPLWLERGVDWKRGGFYDALSMDKAANAADFKRLRVLCRPIYVFSQGVRLGVTGSLEAVRHGVAFLLGPARLRQSIRARWPRH
jgi:mannose/cellobiose epimerase-like protein (N-acyl-D-glucosamine 2-epimerase family)